MSISLLTNFTLNTFAPIDDRIISTNSAARDAIQYKYDGLTVFKTDDRTSWTWNATAATWSYNLTGNGIYAGNGSLVGDTYINIGPISNPLSSITKKFVLSASSSTSNIYYSTYFNRTISGLDWSNVEVKTQWEHDLDTSNIAYISYNPLDPISNISGGIDFGTNNTRRLTITKNGVVRLWSPTYSMDLNAGLLSANRTLTLPNKTDTIATLGDISALAATVSAISLQTVTNVGATSSYPITLNATFSLTQNAKEVVFFDTSNYILSGVISATAGYRNNTIGSNYTETFTIFNTSGITGVISLEVTCNASGLFSYVPSGSSPGAYSRYSRVTKASASFYWNGTAYVQLGSTTIVYTQPGGPGTSYALPIINFQVSGANLRFIQAAYTSPPGDDDIFFNSLNTRIYYKINISKY